MRIVWEFIIKPGFEEEFEQANGPNGEWTKLFQQAPGYIKTELMYDMGQKGRYLTIDHWDSMRSFEEFVTNYVHFYRDMDKKLAHMTEKEAKIGSFKLLD